MAKFILIDPSIQDYQGHYVEYALRVLRAAEERGFEPVVAGNRKLQDLGMPVRSRALYRFGFWYSSTAVAPTRPIQSWRTRMRSAWIAPILWMHYSRLGRWLSMDASWQTQLERQAWRGKVDPSLFLGLLAACLRYGLGSLLSLLTCWLPFRSLIDRGMQSFAAYLSRVKEAFASRLAGIASTVTAALRPNGAVAQFVWQRVKLRQFEKDTRALLDLEPLRAGDMVLLSVTSPVELTALARLFSACPESLRGTWHLVFRHNLQEAQVEQALDEERRPLRNALRAFRASAPADRVFLYTDTEELTAHYNALGIAAFRTLPVPVGRAYFRGRKQAAITGSLRIAYLGDARTEKGYPLLPRLVGDLWPDYVAPGRVTFAIQSNFNSATGSPDVVVARAQLQGWPDDRVRIISEPLTPEAYREEVQAADVLLLPYDGDKYYVRSSGILAEALAAGVPVVVPAGTWMSMQLTRPHFEYHTSLRDSVRVLESRRAEELDWSVGKSDHRRTATADWLSSTYRRRRVCRASIPDGASDVLIAFRQQSEIAGQFVELRILQRRGGQEVVRRNVRVIGGNSSEASTLIRLHRAARSVELSIRDPYSKLPMELHDLRLDFLQSKERLPRSSVGVILNRPGELTRATLELIRHHAHYFTTAQQHAEAWSKRHSPERLVQELLNAAADAPRAGAPEGGLPPSPHFTLRPPVFSEWIHK